MTSIRKSHETRIEVYVLSFEDKHIPGSGFGFPCDAQGHILQQEMTDIAREHLKYCQDGTYAVTAQGVKDYSYTYREPAQCHCSCGSWVPLTDFTNTCDECGWEYNLSGQLLAPRSQWEEPWDEDGMEAFG